MFSFLTSAEEDKKRFASRNPDGIWENGNQICFSCENQFTIVKRRHHCRSCGKEVCATCSALKVEGTRACIFCYVTSKKDVMAMVKSASKTSSPSSADNNSSSNINDDYGTDVSNLSGRETLESFVINQSIVSMSDINDYNNEAYSTDINEMFLRTPSKDKESNNSKVDEKANTFIAPWSVSPSSDGHSPQAVTANNSPNVHVHVNSDHASQGTPIATNSISDQNNNNNNNDNIDSNNNNNNNNNDNDNENNKNTNNSNNESNSSESPAVSVHEKDASVSASASSSSSSSSRESFVEEEKCQTL